MLGHEASLLLWATWYTDARPGGGVDVLALVGKVGLKMRNRLAEI